MHICLTLRRHPQLWKQTCFTESIPLNKVKENQVLWLSIFSSFNIHLLIVDCGLRHQLSNFTWITIIIMICIQTLLVITMSPCFPNLFVNYVKLKFETLWTFWRRFNNLRFLQTVSRFCLICKFAWCNFWRWFIRNAWTWLKVRFFTIWWDNIWQIRFLWW